jgi:hypothetical protein
VGEDARFTGVLLPVPPLPRPPPASPSNTVLKAFVVLFKAESETDDGSEHEQLVEAVLEGIGRLPEPSGVGPPVVSSCLARTGRSGESSRPVACCEELDSWLACRRWRGNDPQTALVWRTDGLEQQILGAPRASRHRTRSDRTHALLCHVSKHGIQKSNDLAECQLNGSVFVFINHDLCHDVPALLHVLGLAHRRLPARATLLNLHPFP